MHQLAHLYEQLRSTRDIMFLTLVLSLEFGRSYIIKGLFDTQKGASLTLLLLKLLKLLLLLKLIVVNRS